MQTDYFAMVSQTYIENWPAELCRLSIAQVDVPLTVDEAAALGSNITEWSETFGDAMLPIDGIRNRVRDAVARLPRGAFVRLGSRSPKDAWSAYEWGMRIDVGDDPLRLILDASERMSDDLHLAIANDYAPHIFVREWIDIPKWAEFRCFMRGRKLAGISQYFYRDGAMPAILDDPGMIPWGIGQFFPEFRDGCHLDDVVFDVYLRRYGHRGGNVEVKLLEINPYCEYTDPCLFDWRRPEMFDGRFLYHK